MKRSAVNAIVDALAAMAILGVVATGIVLRFTLPAGTNRTRLLWGLNRHAWGDIHFWLALALVAVMLVHLALHWSWIVAMVRRWPVGTRGSVATRRTRVVAGVVTAIVIGGLLVGFWRLSVGRVQQVTSHRRDHSWVSAEGPGEIEDNHDGNQLRGSMTLTEVAAAAGVSVEVVKQRLGLPASVLPTRRLGQLGRQYGFTMTDARRALRGPTKTAR